MLPVPAQHGGSAVVAERRGRLNGATAQCFEPGAKLLVVLAEEPRDIAVAQIGPDAVRAEKQYVAGQQDVAAAHCHLGNGRVAAEAALHEIPHRVRRQLFFSDLAFAQQQLDVAVVAGPLHDFAVTQMVYTAVADVSPERRTFLDQADGRGSARPRVDRLAVTELCYFVVRTAQRHVQEAERIEHRQRSLAERFEQALERGVRGAAAVGVAAHAVDDDQQRGLLRHRDRYAVLVVFAVSEETHICVLDPQAGSGARPVSCYTPPPRPCSRARLYITAHTPV